MAAFPNLNSDAGLKKLDEHLLTRSYITGYQASKDDITVFAALAKPPTSQYVNASRWYNHIDALLRISGVSAEGSGVIVEGAAPITEEAIATPPAADSKGAADEEDDDDVDLFGEETEEEKKAAEERAASVKASTKKKESGKSSVLIDIKPWDDETDMKKLEEAVRSIEMEGLFWGASKLMPVGYGIKKLQIMATIVDDLVSIDTMIEEQLTVEPINEYVQSCDIVAFNKIWMVDKFPEGLCSFYRDIYEVVDDPSLDSIISWSKSNKGFVIWNHDELIHRQVISRFHCSEFSEFISELNSFGFGRVKRSAQLEFRNANFVRGQPHLLKKMQIKTALTRWKNRDKARKAKAQVEDRLQHLRI